MIYFKKLIFLLIPLSFLTCVSKKAYQTALSKAEEIQTRNERLREDSTQLTRLNNVLNDVLNDRTEEKIDAELDLITQEAKLERLQNKLQAQRDQIRNIYTSLNQALLGYNQDELYVYRKDGQVHISLSEQLLFPSGSAWVNTKGKKALSTLARVMKDSNEMDIIVEGHTDNLPLKDDGPYVDNWDLSVSRSAAVVRILVNDYQINPQRVTVSGRSKFEPITSNNTSHGRLQNRRTEIILAPDLKEILRLL